MLTSFDNNFSAFIYFPKPARFCRNTPSPLINIACTVVHYCTCIALAGNIFNFDINDFDITSTSIR